jgi:hypothetical protein
MTGRRFRAEQAAYAVLLAACGLGVAVVIAVRTVAEAIDAAFEDLFGATA